MSWSYSGNPSDTPLDETRFLSGDTIETDPLISNEEINYALTKFSNCALAAALVLRALATRAGRDPATRAGDLSIGPERVENFLRLANELDPSGVTKASAGCVIPIFGGVTTLEKDNFDLDTDAVQPYFKRADAFISGVE